MDPIDRAAVLDALNEQIEQCDKALSSFDISMKDEYAVKVERASLVAFRETLKYIPSAQPDRLSDDDFETIRIHLSAAKERLCNQRRWKEAEEYQRIIDRFMEFASVQPERKTGRWIPCSERMPEEDVDVLISYRYKEGEGDTSHTYIDITSFGQMYFGGNKVGRYKHWRAPFEYFESNYEVVAWMPLPEPYKGGEKDGSD